MVTGVLDVLCALCAMGAALATVGAKGARGARPGSLLPVRRTSPDGRGRPLRRHPDRGIARGPDHGGCARSRERGPRT